MQALPSLRTEALEHSSRDRSPVTEGGAVGWKTVDTVKWIATIVQLIGYGLTGLNVVPLNILAFVIGIALWFTVGVMWKDRAIMLVHVGALVALVTGYLNS